MGAVGSKRVAEGLMHCTLWKADRSPACRSVLMTLDALNLSVNEVDVNLDKGEHRTEEIAAMNSLQTLPILKDRELILSDSHAINSYLTSRYYPSSDLLPQEPGARAQIEQLALYNCGTLQPLFKKAAYPILYNNCRYVMPAHVTELESCYAEMEEMLKGRYFGGPYPPTLGDIAILSTVSTLNVMVPVDGIRYPRLFDWLQKMSTEMFQVTANSKGLSEFARRVDSNRINEDDPNIFTIPRTSQRRRFVTVNSAGVPTVPDTTGRPAGEAA